MFSIENEMVTIKYDFSYTRMALVRTYITHIQKMASAGKDVEKLKLYVVGRNCWCKYFEAFL